MRFTAFKDVNEYFIDINDYFRNVHEYVRDINVSLHLIVENSY